MLGRKTLLSLISFLFRYFLRTILFLIAVRKFSPTFFGYRQIAISIFAFFLLFSDLKIDIVHTRFSSEHKYSTNQYFSVYTYLKKRMIAMATMIIVFSICYQLIQGQLSDSREQILILLIIFLEKLIVSINYVYISTLKSDMNIAKLEVANLIGNIIGMVFALFSILILDDFYYYVLSDLLLNLVIFIIFFKFFTSYSKVPIEKTLLKGYIKMDIFYLIPYVFVTIIGNVGTFIFLRYYEEDLLGIYSIIITLFQTIRTLENQFRTLLFPQFIESIKNNDMDQIKEINYQFEKYMGIINIVIIFVGICFCDTIITVLFGKEFVEVGYYFFMGNLIHLYNYPLTGSYNQLILGGDKFKVYIINLLITMMSSLICWYIFIPKWNIVGIEFGRWVGMIPASIHMRYYSYKYYKVGKLGKNRWNLLCLIGMIGLSIYINNYSNFSFILKGILCLISLLIYFGILYLTKTIEKSDYIYIREIINIKKMVNYIKTEIDEDNQ